MTSPIAPFVNPLRVPWRCQKCNTSGVLSRPPHQSCDIDWEQIIESHKKVSPLCDDEYASFQLVIGGEQ